MGAPREHIRQVQTGAVNVIYGSTTGLTPARDQLWRAGSPGIDGDLDAPGWFGIAVAVGHFGKGKPADLAIGNPDQSVDAKPRAGVVQAIYGPSSGLTPAGDQLWSRDAPGILGDAVANEGFGTYLGATR